MAEINTVILNTAVNDSVKSIISGNITNSNSNYVTMWVKKDSNTCTVTTGKYVPNVIDINYSSNTQSVTLPKGTHKIECWGASGATGIQTTINNKIYGDYIYGTLVTNSPTTVYIQTGYQPPASTERTLISSLNIPSFHDGGVINEYSLGQPTGYTCPVSIGGGSTCVMIGGQTRDKRIIVAAGGVGSSYREFFYPNTNYYDVGGNTGYKTNPYDAKYSDGRYYGGETRTDVGTTAGPGSDYPHYGFGHGQDGTFEVGGGGTTNLWYNHNVRRNDELLYTFNLSGGCGSGGLYCGASAGGTYEVISSGTNVGKPIQSSYGTSCGSKGYTWAYDKDTNKPNTITVSSTYKLINTPEHYSDNKNTHTGPGKVKITTSVLTHATQDFNIGKNTLTPILIPLPTDYREGRTISVDATTVSSMFEHTCGSSNQYALNKATNLYYNFTDETDYYIDTNCMKVGNLWYKTDNTTWKSNVAPLLQKTSNGWTKEIMNVFAYDNGEWKTYHPDPIVITFDINEHTYTDWNNVVKPLNTFQGCSITPPTVTFTDNTTGLWNTESDGTGIDITSGFRPIADTTVYLIKQ